MLMLSHLLKFEQILPRVIPFRKLFSTPKLTSHDLVVHRDSDENNPKTPFEFSDSNLTRLEEIIKNYPEGAKQSAVVPALELVQRQIGWVPISAMHKIAQYLNMPRMRVYEVATFYSMIKRRYRGKYNVKVCVTTPCMLRGSDEILAAVEHATECREGGLSPNKMFGVDIVQCQGACANAPVMVVDDDYYEDMTLQDVYNIIATLKCGGIPPQGPQSGRYGAEPICGQNTLCENPPEPGFGLQAALLPSIPPEKPTTGTKSDPSNSGPSSPKTCT